MNQEADNKEKEIEGCARVDRYEKEIGGTTYIVTAYLPDEGYLKKKTEKLVVKKVLDEIKKR